MKVEVEVEMEVEVEEFQAILLCLILSKRNYNLQIIFLESLTKDVGTLRIGYC